MLLVFGKSLRQQHHGTFRKQNRETGTDDICNQLHGWRKDEWQSRLLNILPVHHLVPNVPMDMQFLIFSPENKGPKNSKPSIFWHVRGESDKVKFSCHTGWREFKYVIVFSVCFVPVLPFYLLLLKMTSFSQTLPLLPLPQAFSKHEPHGSASLVSLFVYQHQWCYQL